MINDEKIKIHREREGAHWPPEINTCDHSAVGSKKTHQPVRLGIYLDGPSEEHNACKDSTVHIPAIPDFSPTR